MQKSKSVWPLAAQQRDINSYDLHFLGTQKNNKTPGRFIRPPAPSCGLGHLGPRHPPQHPQGVTQDLPLDPLD